MFETFSRVTSTLCTGRTINLHGHESWDVLHEIITIWQHGFRAAKRNADRQRDVQQLYRASGNATLITCRTGRDAKYITDTGRSVTSVLASLRVTTVFLWFFLFYATQPSRPSLSTLWFTHRDVFACVSHSFTCMRATSCVQLNFFRYQRAWQFWYIQLQTVYGFDKSRYYFIFVKLNLKRF